MIFRLVVRSMLNKQVAYDLGITEKTIKVHPAQVMQKMGTQSLADLVRPAENLGIRSSPKGLSQVESWIYRKIISSSSGISHPVRDFLGRPF